MKCIASYSIQCIKHLKFLKSTKTDIYYYQDKSKRNNNIIKVIFRRLQLKEYLLVFKQLKKYEKEMPCLAWSKNSRLQCQAGKRQINQKTEKFLQGKTRHSKFNYSTSGTWDRYKECHLSRRHMQQLLVHIIFSDKYRHLIMLIFGFD